MRFLVHPQPDLTAALAGAAISERAGLRLRSALAGAAAAVGVPLTHGPPATVQVFNGPTPGSRADPRLLARACWALALLTTTSQHGPGVTESAPLAQLRPPVTGEGLLSLAPPAALDQLDAIRGIFHTHLLPQLATRPGRWALAPRLAGDGLLNAHADLIAAGMLLELTTTTTLSLPPTTLLRLAGTSLVDFADEYQLTTVAVFSARHAYLATWNLPTLLSELAGHPVDLPAVRTEFRQLVHSHQPPTSYRPVR